MSTLAISSNLLPDIGYSTSTADLFVTGLNQLSMDIQENNLSAAEQDYVTLSQDALSGIIATAAETKTTSIATTLIAEISSTALNPHTSASNVTLSQVA